MNGYTVALKQKRDYAALKLDHGKTNFPLEGLIEVYLIFPPGPEKKDAGNMFI